MVPHILALEVGLEDELALLVAPVQGRDVRVGGLGQDGSTRLGDLQVLAVSVLAFEFEPIPRRAEQRSLRRPRSSSTSRHREELSAASARSCTRFVRAIRGPRTCCDEVGPDAGGVAGRASLHFFRYVAAGIRGPFAGSVVDCALSLAEIQTISRRLTDSPAAKLVVRCQRRETGGIPRVGGQSYPECVEILESPSGGRLGKYGHDGRGHVKERCGASHPDGYPAWPRPRRAE